MPPRVPASSSFAAGDPRRQVPGGVAFLLPALLALTAGCSAAVRPVESVPSRVEAREVSEAPAPAEARPVEPRTEPAGGETAGRVVAEEPDMPEGVFHRVEPGQTLWRIARAYGVDLDSLAKANGLDDPRSVETGKMLFVPGASLKLDVAPYPAPIPPEGESARTQPMPQAPVLDGGEFAWPVAGGEILSTFGVPRRRHRHAGLDIRGASGQDVVAAARGEVAYAAASPGGYGKLVILDHGDGLQTIYAHNSRILVRVGDVVERGQPVAHVGRTGNATTDHCHFEIRKDKVAVDPLDYYPDQALTARNRREAPGAGGSTRPAAAVSVGEAANR